MITFVKNTFTAVCFFGAIGGASLLEAKGTEDKQRADAAAENAAAAKAQHVQKTPQEIAQSLESYKAKMKFK